MNQRVLNHGIRAIGFGVLLICLSVGTAMAQDEEGKKSKPDYDAYEEFAKANKYVSYGSYSKAIPHYERVLAVEPLTYNIVHYNLGEIYRAKKNCVKAVFHYTAYLGTGTDAEALDFSRKSIAECDTSTWPTLTVTATPDTATIKIDGFIFSQNGKIEQLKIGPGGYELEVSAPEFISQTREIKLESKKVSEERFDLEKQTFFGSVHVEVDQPGAKLKLIPRKLDKPELSPGEMALTSPLKEPAKLPTGKYLLEVNLDGYDRWIRHIYITRDQKIDVDVRLTKAMPIELKAQ